MGTLTGGLKKLAPLFEPLSAALFEKHLTERLTDNETWKQVLASWIPKVLERNIPLLGICFGHQLLAKAMGGYSDYHPRGREIGTVSIQLSPEGRQDRLLGYLPDEFYAHTTHAQTIIK